jgi:RNA polymerase sigma-70 factor, ECF subfamily
MDRVLVEQAMAGDRGAFNELASLTIGRLYGLAVLILRDPDRASDATQEALIAAWRDLSALRDPGRFDAWVHRVLVRACHEEARRDRRRRTVEIHEIPLERVDAHPADERPAFIDRDQLEGGFRRLSVEERAIVVLHHIEGFPLAAIAEMLGIPIGTVKSKLHRSLQTMRAALDADARVVTMERERIA